jgi:hypothetical protein
MARPPSPEQKTYRGRIRADIRSAFNHLEYLYNWDQKYRENWAEGPTYPSQLGTTIDMYNMGVCLGLLERWLASKGPIPTNTDPPGRTPAVKGKPLLWESFQSSPPDAIRQPLDAGVSVLPGVPLPARGAVHPVPAPGGAGPLPSQAVPSQVA